VKVLISLPLAEAVHPLPPSHPYRTTKTQHLRPRKMAKGIMEKKIMKTRPSQMVITMRRSPGRMLDLVIEVCYKILMTRRILLHKYIQTNQIALTNQITQFNQKFDQVRNQLHPKNGLQKPSGKVPKIGG